MKKEGDFHAPKQVVAYPRQERTESHRAGDAIVPDHSNHPPIRSKSEIRRLMCPVCSIPMELRIIGATEVDRCPRCDGIFLDRGELKAISGRDFSTYQKSTQHATEGQSSALAHHEKEYIIYTPHGLSDKVRSRD